MSTNGCPIRRMPVEPCLARPCPHRCRWAWSFWGCRSASRLCCGSSRATKASHAIAGRLRNFPLVSSTRRGKFSRALTRPADRFPVARRNARDDPLEVAGFEHDRPAHLHGEAGGRDRAIGSIIQENADAAHALAVLRPASEGPDDGSTAERGQSVVVDTNLERFGTAAAERLREPIAQ